MTWNIIKTGSKGNACIIDGTLLLDVGVPIQTVGPYVNALKAVFVSHIHSDHFNRAAVNYIAAMRPSVRFLGGSWMAKPFLDAGVDIKQIDVLEEGYWYDYKRYSVSPVRLDHDVPNFGLRVRNRRGERLLYAVDTNTLEHVHAKDYDVYLVEANYEDAEICERIRRKEAAGEFVYEHRVLQTHMEKADTLRWLSDNMGDNSSYVLLHGHVEE